MTTTNSKQMTAGKAFEYALLLQFKEKLQDQTNVSVINNSSYKIARGCFSNITKTQKSEYLLTASFAVNFLIDIEPRLQNDLGSTDVLELEISPDHKGKLGDVRDILAIRKVQQWEIGVSAKHNHHAVKHSRLSTKLDFGQKWFGAPVSTRYFETVSPIFNNLSLIRKESRSKAKWAELGDYHTSVYVPILEAFINELKNLCKKQPSIVAPALVLYLVGNKDFYKVIKVKNGLEIHAYNINNTLNLPFKKIKPKFKTPKVLLPTKVLDVKFKTDSDTTAIVTMDNDWILSFRIHNASSRVEASLKFDINLIKAPDTLFKNTLNILTK